MAACGPGVCVKHKCFCMFETELLIYIDKEVDKEDIPSDPHEKTHKCAPNAIATFAAKVIAAVDMMLILNSVDLFHLPIFIYRHSLRHIGLPHDKSDCIAISTSEGNESST